MGAAGTLENYHFAMELTVQIRLAPGVRYGGPVPGPLPYSEFARWVRRLPRSSLLRHCATTSAALEQVWAEQQPSLHSSVQPWSLAGVARTCLAVGTDDRSANVSDNAVASLCSAFIQVGDPDAKAGMGIERVITKIAFEQFTSQYSKMENLARSGALLLDHADGVPGAPTAQDWVDLLGVDLEQYMRIGFAVFVAVVQNAGSVSRELLQADHVAPIFAPLSAAEALNVLDQHFVTPLDRLREEVVGAEVTGREKWSWNPLAATPLVEIGDELVAPAAHLILDKITTTGLYYTAAPVWRSRFTDALGGMFEDYVGTHLGLLTQARLHPEIVYGPTGQKSCDYMLVFNEVVVLVEVKSLRPTIYVRTGQDDGEAELTKRIGHARDQLVRSARLIREGHPAFAEIPKDRPMVGLIVTLEPFHLHQTGRAEQLLVSDELSVSTAWSHDLEGTVGPLAGADDAGARLLRVLGDPEPWRRHLRESADGLPDVENPILDGAYERWWSSMPQLADRTLHNGAAPAD